MVKQSGSRAAGGLATVARMAALTALTLLILVSGAWGSWRTAHDVMVTKGHDQGTVTLAHCGDSTCTGPFAPSGSALPRPLVSVSLPIRHHVGEQVKVVLEPDSDTALRAGLGGVLFAWLPLAGALVLAAVVVGGGLRMSRTAWTMAWLGGALMGATFLTL